MRTIRRAALSALVSGSLALAAGCSGASHDLPLAPRPSADAVDAATVERLATMVARMTPDGQVQVPGAVSTGPEAERLRGVLDRMLVENGPYFQNQLRQFQSGGAGDVLRRAQGVVHP